MTDSIISQRLRVLALTAALAGPGVIAQAAPESFETPEAAAAAVVAALEARERAALGALFGIVVEAGVGTLYVGRDQWPFPGPLVEGPDGWSFDAAAAREEVLLRRIGGNELDVIEVMRGYVAAQRAYRAGDPDGDGVRAFASAVLSDPGARNGLYWPDAPGAPESPVGDFMARAAAEGYSVDGVDEDPEPFHGYYFRILTRQGSAAPGGEYDYMVAGRMLGGHALLAFPAAYGDSGIMSFMVGEAGLIYEADLGEDTLALATAIEAFDPGPDWTPIAD
mgnify:CR=1 FL=1